MTHTFATLEISAEAFDEINYRLRKAGATYIFCEPNVLDIQGRLTMGPSIHGDGLPREAFEFAWSQARNHCQVDDGEASMESAWQAFLSTRVDKKPSEFDEKDPRSTI